MVWQGVLLACCLPGLALASVCGQTLPAKARQQTTSAGHTVAFATSAWPLPVGQHFNVDLYLCAADAADKTSVARIDADMPAHRHGMNYRPALKALGGGRYQASGLMFHMPGTWRFIFELKGLESGAGPTRRLTHEVVVE